MLLGDVYTMFFQANNQRTKEAFANTAIDEASLRGRDLGGATLKPFRLVDGMIQIMYNRLP